MHNPFSWDYMRTMPGPSEVFGPFAIIFLVIFGFGFVLAVFLYNDGARRYTNHALKRRTIRRGAGISMVVFGLGLFFFGVRLLQINPFSFGERIWLWLSFVSALAMAAYFAYYTRTVYRDALTAYEADRQKRQYLSTAAAAAGQRVDSNAHPYAPRRPVKRKKR